MSADIPGACDIAIRGGEVIDGSGDLRRAADVLISDGLIAAIVPPGAGRARTELGAEGLIVCPGFIDSHSHDDQFMLAPRLPHPKLAQGVCTVVTGNCGVSLAPLVTPDPPAPLDILGRDSYRFDDFAAYLDALDDALLHVNVAPLIGHTTLRVSHVKDIEEAATAGEIRAMHDEVAQAMDAGAFGLSTGVYYPPASAATMAELRGVASALRGRQAVLATHLRDEGDDIDNALREAFAVALAAQATLVLSHHKVVGRQNHGRTRVTLAMIDAAARLQPVCLDCYPYEASSTMLAAEKAARTGRVIVTWSQPHPELGGRNLQQIANGWEVSLEEAARRLMPGGAIYFAMSEEDVQRVLSHPLTMIGSDGLPHDASPHPRLWGSFPKVLGHYSRDLGLMPLETAVHKMTGLPAAQFRLHRRGLLKAGYAADVVIFDPRSVRDTASYGQPVQCPEGIAFVLVNGRIAVANGKATGRCAGKRLRPAPVVA